MASKFVPLIAVLAAIIFHVATATSRTTIDIHGGRFVSEECRSEVQSRDLSPCVRFLIERDQRPSGSDWDLSGRGSQNFYQCCQELKDVRDYTCRCEGLRAALEESRGPREFRGLASTAEGIPRMCGVGPETCRFSTPWY